MYTMVNPEESTTKEMNIVSLVGSLRPPYQFGGANANDAFDDVRFILPDH